MILTAIICIVLGIGLIVLCIFLPTGGEDEKPQTEEAKNGEAIIKNTPSDPEIPDSEPVETGQSDLPVSDEPAEPDEPESETPSVSAKNDPLLVLANVDNPLPEDFEVGDLETVQGNYQLDSRAASYAREMIEDAKSEGITLQLCSAYRAISLQQTLFDNKYNEYISNGWTAEDAYAKTATIIAVPGTSEHQTGLCMDVVTPSYQVLDEGYADTDAAKWLAENAYKYGFILRYPKDKQEITKIIFEPWHYRFVGIENAKLIKDSGLCLEEYLDTLE